MDLQKFDSTIKNALENLQPPYDPDSWAALESRLSAIPRPETIDQIVRPALERMEAPFDSAGWQKLAGRMDGLLRVRRLRATKAAEAAILLLLLLNFNGLWSVVESAGKPAPVRKEQAPEPMAHKKAGKHARHNAAPSGHIIEAGADAILAAMFSSAATATTGNGTTIETNNTASLLNAGRFYNIPVIPPSAIAPVQESQIQYAANIVPIPLIDPAASRSSRLYAASFGAFEKNYIKDGAHSDNRNGYAGGVAIGYRKGKWGIETGLAYAPKAYTPQVVKEEVLNNPIQGLLLRYADAVDADVFTVPVKVTRRLAKVGNTTIHAQAGVNTSIATSKRYHFKNQYYPPPNQSGQEQKPPRPDMPAGAGLLENGSLKQNVYATVEAGLRIEHPIGKRYVAYLAPAFQQHLGGNLGPHAARINTFSLQAGVMASL